MNIQVSSEGQIQIPPEIRDRLGILPGIEVQLEVIGDTLQVRKTDTPRQTPQLTEPLKTLEDIQTALKRLLPFLQTDYHVSSLGIFGSYVRGEQTPDSDVDLLIEFEPTARFGLLKFCELEDYLSDQLGLKVDLVSRGALKPTIGQRILKEVLPI